MIMPEFINIASGRRKVFATLCGLYVMQAIPIYLFGAAIPVILRDQGVDLATIGSLALLFLPWVLKFLWAPYIDRWTPPFLGPRKGWIIPTQILICLIITVMAFLNPTEDLFIIFIMACSISFLAATQDIATDGYAVELLEETERPLGNGIQGGSVAVGVILGGTVTLLLYDVTGWTVSILMAAAAGFLFMMPVFFIEEAALKKQAANQAAPDKASLLRFLVRPEARRALYYVLAYRLSEGFIKAMEQAFFVDQGLSVSTIGLISGGSAAVVGLAGSALGVVLVRKWKAGLVLLLLAVARTAIFLGYVGAATLDMSDPLILISLSVLNTFVRYMEIVALFNLCMQVCHKQQAGTDFTILSCANLFVYMCGGMLSGIIADQLGYSVLFSIATALSFIGVLQGLHFIRNDYQNRLAPPETV